MADPIEITAPVTIPAAIEITAPVTIGGIGGGGSGASWGSITGTLSSQTDLQAALDAKAASGHTHAQYVTTANPILSSGALTVGTITMSASSAGYFCNALGSSSFAVDSGPAANIRAALGAAASSDLHNPVTVTGNGITLTGQQIALSIGTGATQVAQGNHTHTAADVGAVAATLGTATNLTLANNLNVPSAITMSGTTQTNLRSALGLGASALSTQAVNTSSDVTFANVNSSGNVIADFYSERETDLGTVTTSANLIHYGGSAIRATLTASTECTFALATPGAGESFILYLKQAPSTGNGTAVFPGVVWSGGTAPTITAAAGKMDIISFVAGPNAAGTGYTWYASAVQNLTPP